MIKILQTGQAGSTRHLVDMHRVRTKIFRDRMGWDVDVNAMELEVDDYDLPETIYILHLDQNEQVTGTWRFLTTDQPSMIRNIWPQYTETLPVPLSSTMCETSRFGVHSETKDRAERQKQVNLATAEMIVALIDTCMLCGITDMFTLYNVKIKRLLERIGFKPAEISAVIDLEGEPTVTARFDMSKALLDAVRASTGITLKIHPEDLPPLLVEKYLMQAGPEEFHERRVA
jgi:acyl homoserine lactone synthase